MSGKNKNKLRTIYSKNHGNFKNGKPRIQFYWFLHRKECICQNKKDLVSTHSQKPSLSINTRSKQNFKKSKTRFCRQ